MPIADPVQKWPFSRDVNMREDSIVAFLKGERSSGRGNPAALPSTLMDFGFWDMRVSRPTPVGQALVDGKIFWSECVLWLLSKRPSSRDAENIKPLVVVCKFLCVSKDIGIDPSLYKVDIAELSQVDDYAQITPEFVRGVISKRGHSKALHTYADIWVNSFAETALFKLTKSESGKRDKLIVVTVTEDPWRFVRFVADFGHKISATPPKRTTARAKDAFYDYMGSDETGIVEILIPQYFRNLFPNLLSNIPKGFSHTADLREQFRLWLVAKGLARSSQSYPPSLDALSAPMNSADKAKHSTYSWPGIYEYLLGRKPEVSVFSIGDSVKFEQVYGGFAPLLFCSNRKNPGFLNQERFEECWDYTHTDFDWSDHTTLVSAFKKYCEFLEWRDVSLGCQSPKINPPRLPDPEDRLTVALKLFERVRNAKAEVNVRYWVFSPGEQANRWDEMRNGGVMALSYEECGRDLREYVDEEAIRATFKYSEEDDASYKNHVRALTDFLNVMKPGDLVFAKKGTKTFLGVGRVTGEYEFAADAPDYKHRRAVEWLKVETIERDDAVARKTLTDVTRYGDLVRELCEAYGISDSGLSGGAGWSGYWELNPGARQYFDALRKNIDNLDKDKVVEMFTGVKKNGKVVFKPMWSGSNGTGWNSLKRGLEEENSKTIETIRRYCESAADLAVFTTKEDGKNRPLGFGNSVVSELLMKFHPDVAMKCGRKTIAVYHDLHLMEFKRPDDYSAMEYTKALGIAADIRQRMDQLGITRMVEDKESADYLTVNEFIAWCGDNKDLIKEEIMTKEFKKVEKKPKKDGTKKLSDMMQDELLKRLAAALRTKPFAILAGHSGTGKSQMVRRLAYMTCADEGLMAEAKEKNAPGNFCMIQVRPNWHDSTDLLGYYSELGKKYRTTEFVEFVAKAHAYPEIPFFVCLDEMNLAPVEQYFAEYLSAIESADVKGGEFLTDALVSKEFPADEVMFHDEVRFSESKAWFEKHGLTIPKNLFVVGTVNMDDTTCQFSRKVLDRAMTIMMDKVSFRDMQDAAKSAAPSEADLLQYDDIKAFLGGELRAKPLDDDQVKMLEALEGVLGKTPFAVAYRYANEYALYEDSLLALEGKKHEDADADHAKTAMDHCVLMKVLPRVHGERKEMELIFRGKLDGTEKGLEGLLDKDTTLSGKKMEEILARKATYLSFWP